MREDSLIGGAPTHGGLAGPSNVMRGDSRVGGAPTHGGLAERGRVVAVTSFGGAQTIARRLLRAIGLLAGAHVRT